tara:strand:+ start:2085 stop:2555 length:471 start_codon:yes stop_codon:yes gene_type:complete
MFKKNKILNYEQIIFSFSEFKKELIDLQNDGYNVYIGADSQIVKDKVSVVACVCLYKQSKGGRVFYVKERIDKSKFPTTRMRLLYEAYKSIEVAMEIEEFVTEDLTIHLDIGSDIMRSLSAKYKKEAESIVLSMGYNCEIKPDSWASSVADRFTKT